MRTLVGWLSLVFQWEIDHIFTITVDNESSNDVAIEYLRRKTKDRVGSLLGCKFLHMHYCALILNLIVQDGSGGSRIFS